MASAQEAIIDLAVVPVHVGLGKTGPWAKPEKPEAWLRAKDADTVRFQGTTPFTIEFEQKSPFPEKEYASQAGNGLHVVEATVRLDAEELAYKYDLTIDGKTLDPEVVVKKDPREP